MASEIMNDDDFNPKVKYLSENEPRPKSVVYTAEFRDLEAALAEAAALFREPIQNCKYRNAITKGLLTEVTKLAREDSEEQLNFAIEGSMSAGRSSVINSLFSIGMLARNGADGESYTWVMHRYKAAFPLQASAFAFKVSFF